MVHEQSNRGDSLWPCKGRVHSTEQEGSSRAPGPWTPALTPLSSGAARWAGFLNVQVALLSGQDSKVSVSQQLPLLTLTNRRHFQTHWHVPLCSTKIDLYQLLQLSEFHFPKVQNKDFNNHKLSYKVLVKLMKWCRLRCFWRLHVHMYVGCTYLSSATSPSSSGAISYKVGPSYMLTY